MIELNRRRLLVAAASATALGVVGPAAASAEEAASSPKPGEIRGVKWKQSPVGREADIDWWLEVPKNKTKADVARELKANGVNAVVIRVDRWQRFRQAGETKEKAQQDWQQAMDDIVDAIKVLNREGVHAYLWARIWWERDGEPNFATFDKTVRASVDRFVYVLDKAKAEGVFEAISGLGYIETNCDTIADVHAYARGIARRFNNVERWKDANGNGFLQSRTFLVPGAGFGLDFRGVENDSDFLPAIEQETGYFSYIYKFMYPNHETQTRDDYNNVLLSDGNTYDFDDIAAKDANLSVDLRKQYLKIFNVDGLVRHINEAKANAPRAANVLFWGDSQDGMDNVPPQTRKAIYDLLVKDGPASINSATSGKFFSMTAYVTETLASTYRKNLVSSLLDNHLRRNSHDSHQSDMSVYEQWRRWGTSVNPGYEEPRSVAGRTIALFFGGKWLAINEEDGKLYADRETVVKWGRFTVEPAGDGYIRLKAMNGRYVAATPGDPDATLKLVTRPTAATRWDWFDRQGSSVYFRSDVNEPGYMRTVRDGTDSRVNSSGTEPSPSSSVGTRYRWSLVD